MIHLSPLETWVIILFIIVFVIFIKACFTNDEDDFNIQDFD